MAVGNRKAVDALARTKTNIDSGIFRAIQDAAIVALEGDQTWLDGRNEIYRQRRDLILSTLPALGMKADKPEASLYIWATIPAGYDSSVSFTTRLLEDAGVSIAPGTAFGSLGEGYVRISLGMSTERVREAMERLKRFSL
jgi:LL-diaminopimelate aminotransferase